MAKTQLTLDIEKRLYDYNPDTTGGCTINKFRGRHIGYEVPVTCGTTAGGIVDCMRVDEILVNGSRSFICSVGHAKDWYHKNHPTVMNYIKCMKNYTAIDQLPTYCDMTSCNGNCRTTHYDNEICVTCYEIKVTKEDFHSSHGHNFVGNANYYVMPETLYKSVKSEISEDIGVIIYKVTDKSESLRRVKECKFKPLDADTQRWLILNVMKKKLNYSDYNQIIDVVKQLRNLIPRECSTCDLSNSCTEAHRSTCIEATRDSKHCPEWQCKDAMLHRLGIMYDHEGGSLFV